MTPIEELLKRVKTDDIRKELLFHIPMSFKDHVAVKVSKDHIIWAKPGSNIDRIEYVTKGPWLFVFGDWGTSTWCRESGFEFWANASHISYLMTKLESSSESFSKYERGHEWDDRIVEQRLRAEFSGSPVDRWFEKQEPEYQEELEKFMKPMDHDAKDNFLLDIALNADEDMKTLLHTLRGAAMDNPFWYSHTLHEERDQIEKYFGQDFYELSGLMSPGLRRATRIDGHILGLRLALEQLKSRPPRILSWLFK